MRAILLSWEYPPMRVGGIAAALEGLAPALARAGVETHVVTCGDSGGAPEENPEPNLYLHRVTVSEPSDNFVHWVHLLNDKLDERADALIREWQKKEARKKNKTPILIHVHDWLGQFAGIALKHRYKLPMLSTIHATEFGRNGGIRTEGQRYINRCEWELASESWRVIVCSDFMRGEVEYALGVPWDKMDVLPNGVEARVFEGLEGDAWWSFRRRYAADNEKIVFFIGRPVHEKGAHVLVQALPRVRARGVNAKLVIAGGGVRGHLEALAGQLGMWPHVYFTGRVSDQDRDNLYQVADVAVFPSLYEPFGIVALEAMAAHTPVVVSDAGGLAEVVEHNITGTTTFKGDPDSLAWGIARAVNDPGHSRWMAQNAYERVETIFNWDVIAADTKAVYTRVWDEYKASGWGG